MNGFVPVIFTLTFVSRYGRLSWHIIALSVLTIALATGVLATTSVEAFGGYVYLNERERSFAGVTDSGILELADLICGSNSSILKEAIEPIPINMVMVWVI